MRQEIIKNPNQFLDLCLFAEEFTLITNSTNSKTTKDAIDGNNLTLNTNTLTFSNLYDSDEARSFGIGLGGNLRSGGNGSGSISLDYSMHDFKQTTNATIGNGIIKTGTTLNLDSNNNLISVDGGIIYGEEGSKTYAASGLNRNIQISQLETKHLEVKPIHIKETFEFGRNSSSNQKSADSNGSGSDSSSSSRPTIWQDITKDRSDQSTAQAAGSMVSDVGSGLLTNLTITLKDLGYQINPLRGFGNILNGISTDIGNLRTELGIKTQTLNVGDDRKFINIDKDGKQIGNSFTLEEYLQNPTLAATKLFSNGIMNNFDDAKKNAREQLKTTDESGRITILFDPSAAPDAKFSEDPWGNIFGLGSDLWEVSVNYLGANVLGGLIQTKGQKTDQDFITAVTNNAKETNTLITLAGHSGGGLRNYLTLYNSSPDQYLDNNGNSILQLQFSGTPANYFDIKQVSQNAGITEVRMQNNSGDFVGNGLGMNGTILDAIWSGINIVSLFEAPIKPNINNMGRLMLGDVSAPSKIGDYFMPLKSPHASYPCILSGCKANTNLNFNQNSPLAPPSNINLNSDLR
jgi:hypothetical protein